MAWPINRALAGPVNSHTSYKAGATPESNGMLLLGLLQLNASAIVTASCVSRHAPASLLALHIP